jgi:hypothetical protein
MGRKAIIAIYLVKAVSAPHILTELTKVWTVAACIGGLL